MHFILNVLSSFLSRRDVENDEWPSQTRDEVKQERKPASVKTPDNVRCRGVLCGQENLVINLKNKKDEKLNQQTFYGRASGRNWTPSSLSCNLQHTYHNYISYKKKVPTQTLE